MCFESISPSIPLSLVEDVETHLTLPLPFLCVLDCSRLTGSCNSCLRADRYTGQGNGSRVHKQLYYNLFRHSFCPTTVSDNAHGRALASLTFGTSRYRVGDLRLRLPRPIESYDGTINATEIPAQCIQLNPSIRTDMPAEMLQDMLAYAVTMGGSGAVISQSEDCITFFHGFILIRTMLMQFLFRPHHQYPGPGWNQSRCKLARCRCKYRVCSIQTLNTD